MQLRHALVVEWDFPANQDVENNAKTPHVNLRACVCFCLEKLWSGKIQAATKCLQSAPRGEQVAETKVDDFDIAFFADQDVFNFQISVDDAITVTVIKRTGNLPGKFAGLFLFQPTVRDDVVQHLTAVDVFEHHVPMVIGPVHITHAANVWMVDECHYRRLSLCPDLF